jgi:outer membrane protein W
MLRSFRVGVKVCISCVLGALVVGVLDSPQAFAQQRFNFYVGEFFPRGQQTVSSTITGRSVDDVLAANAEFLTFNLTDFKAPSFGAEYLTGLGNHFEAGLGIGFQSKAVPSLYTDFVNANGNEIEQELKLRVIPATATIRFLPLGNDSLTPYIGAGVGVFNWRYSETGQFLATDGSIFSDTFVGSGSQAGLVVLGGIRVPVGNWGVGGELRYQKAEANLPADQEFAGSKIDLGGFTGLFTVHVRF